MINYSKHFFCLIIFSVFLLQSCSVEKRRYTSGYNLQWKKGNNTLQFQKSDENITQVKNENKKVKTIPSSEEVSVICTKSFGLLTASSEKKKGIILLAVDSTGCDTLIMRDETEIKVKVIEITPTEIKYKYCDHINGPTYVLYRYNVSYIKYANGSMDSFVKEHVPTPTIVKNDKAQSRYQDVDDDRTERYVRKKSVASIFFGAFSIIPIYGVPAAIISIILGTKCLRLISKDPLQLSQYRQRTIIGLVLGIIGLLITIFLFALLLIALGII
jgi:hypothetical protein